MSEVIVLNETVLIYLLNYMYCTAEPCRVSNSTVQVGSLLANLLFLDQFACKGWRT